MRAIPEVVWQYAAVTLSEMLFFGESSEGPDTYGERWMDKPPQNALTELRVLVRKVIGWVLAPIEVVAFAIHFFVGRIAQLYAGYGVIAALLFAAYWIFRFLVGLAPTSTEVTPPPPVPTTLEKRDVQQPLESPLSRREGVGDRMPVRGAEQIS